MAVLVKYSFFSRFGINEKHLSGDLSVIPISDPPNGLLLDLFKYRKDKEKKKISWAEIQTLLCGILGDSSISNQLYKEIQCRLHNLRKQERTLSKIKKKNELLMFLEEPFTMAKQAVVSQHASISKAMKLTIETKSVQVRNLQRQLRKRNTELSEIESELTQVTKHKKETEELLQDKEEEVITQRMQLSEATKKKVMIMMQCLTFILYR